MRNPPRRSRPKKPAQTIDLTATAIPAVGYPGPMSSESRSFDGNDSFEGDASERLNEADAAGGGDGGGVVAVPLGTAMASDVIETSPVPDADEAGTSAATAEAQSPVDAEAMLAETASQAAEPAEPRSATEAFAAEESLTGSASGDRRQSDLDETILSAAVPDFVNEDGQPERPSEPPAPTYDYNTATTSHHDAKGGGFGSTFAAALLGAVVALGAGGALQYAGYIPSLGVDDSAETLSQFARTGDVQQVGADLGALRSEVEQLRSAQAAGGTGAGATSADLTAVADRVTAMEQRGDQGAASGAVNEEAIQAAQAKADQALAAADAAAKAAGAASETAGRAQAAADQARQTGETASQAAATAQQAAATAQQAATAAQDGATGANAAIKAFEPRFAAIETANKAAGIAISAAALKAAIDRSGPFMSELEAFASTAGPSPAIETLRGFAADGVPSAEALRADWPGVKGVIVAALNPPDPNATVQDQLLTGLSALVTSRPVAAAPAGTPGTDAAVSRLDAAIEGGNFDVWLSEWQTLPQSAKDASQAFQARVSARAETQRIVGRTLQDAVKAGGQSAGTAG